MKLSRIDKEIAPVILERGEAYREDGRIQYVEEVQPGVYEAQVDGSEDYYIEIRLKDGEEVVGTSCDCPFDGPICKHVAAVLLELRDELAAEAAQPVPAGKTASSAVNLVDELGRLSKEELVGQHLQFAGDMNGSGQGR